MKSRSALTFSVVFGILVIAAVIFVGCTSTSGEKVASTNVPATSATKTVMTPVPVSTGTTPLTTTTSPLATGTIALATTAGPTASKTATPTVSTTGVATSSQSTPTVSVSYNNHDFKPSPLTISRDTTVLWTNKDPSAISFVSEASAPVAFRSGLLASGSTYQFTFTQPGLYRYHTETSPQSGGQITVT